VKKPLIWTTAVVAVVGFGIPAYAAVSSNSPTPDTTTPSTVTVPTSAATIPASAASVAVAVRTGSDDINTPQSSVDDNGSGGGRGGGSGGGGDSGGDNRRSHTSGTAYYGPGGDG
jgi:uncharacterized membrane protein YgcG